MKRLLAILGLLALLGPACAPKPPRATSETNLVVAVLGGFSGDSRHQAADLARGVEMAIIEYNSHPDSSFRVRLTRADTKGTAEGAAEAAKRLTATDLLVGVIGPFTQVEAIAAGATLSDARIPFLIPTLSDESLSQSGWSTFRRLVATDRQEGAQLAKTASRSIEGSKIAVFHDGVAQSIAAAEGAKAAAEEARVGVTRLDPLTDPKAAAAASVADSVGGVVFAGSAEKAGALAAALGEQGFKGRYFATHQAREAQFRKSAGNHAEGTISDCVCADAASPNIGEFVSRYRQRFGAVPGQFAVEAFDGTWMLLDAIQEVDPRPGDISSFLTTARDFLGEAKRYKYGEGGELIDPAIFLREFRKGRWVPLGSSDISRKRAPE